MSGQVYYHNGNFYDRPISGVGSAIFGGADAFIKMNNIKPIVAPQMSAPTQSSQMNNSGMWNNPFATAMSGTQSGTLQPYVNRMTQNANRALYGGLLGYQPQPIVAGDAGGTPVNSTPPQFNMQSAIPQQGQGLNFTGFGNRSWMGK